jgi:hypothetical protein
MRGRFVRVLVCTAASLVLALAAAAIAQAAVSVSIERNATLVGAGEAVQVRVNVTCDPGFEVLEANISVSQRGTTGFGGIPGVVCDGTTHTLTATVSAQEGSYRRGTASASAFVLVIDPNTQDTQSGQATAKIKLR